MTDPMHAQDHTSTLSHTNGAERLAAGAGLAFVTTFLIWLVVVFDGPMFTEPASAVREYLAQNPTLIRVASFVIAAGAVLFLLPFVAALSQRLVRANPAERWWGRVIVASALFSIVMFLLDAALGATVSLSGVANIPDPALEAIWNASRVINASFNHLGTGVWVAVAGVAILRSSALPRWIGWIGIGLLIPQLVTASWLLGGEFTTLHDAAGGIGQLGSFLVWIPAVAITMLRNQQTPGAAPAHQ